MWIRGTYPFCYTCVNNPFPSFSPTPSPSPTPIRLPIGSPCFSNAGCLSDYCGPDFHCASPSPTPTPECATCFDVWAFPVDPTTCNCPAGFDPIDGCCYDSFWGGGGGGDGYCGDWCDYWNPCWCATCDAWGWGGFGICAFIEPILIDVAGNSFDLTNAANGVPFDFFAHGNPLRISWTAQDSDDAWLVLDRNANSNIDNGKELFGNVTPQSRPAEGSLRLGFLALGMYDRTAHGGNGDGEIDSHDRIFAQLRLWQDVNHNGVSEASELHTLNELGVESISLDYRLSQRTDRYGNIFRYRAKAYGPNHRDLGRWAYDVILEGEQNSDNAQTRSAIARTDAVRRLLAIPISNDFIDRSSLGGR